MQQLRERRLTNTPQDVPHFIQQVRKCNRKLFKGDRSHIKNIADRFVKGYQIFLFERAKTLLIERRTGFSSPCLKAGVSEA
jgi:hypothetical protein